MQALHRPLIALALALACAAGRAAPAAQPEADPGPAVQRQGQGWLLQPRDQGLASLAQALAQQSGSRLAGAVQALYGLAAPKGQPQWRVASLDQAWSLLLDGRINHARQCQGQGQQQRCTLWLTGAVAGAAPQAGAGRAAGTEGLSAAGRPGAAQPVAATPPPPTPPAPPPMPTADPPGLFPSQPEA